METKYKFTMNIITVFTIFMLLFETFVPLGEYMYENFGTFSLVVADLFLIVSFVNIIRIIGYYLMTKNKIEG